MKHGISESATATQTATTTGTQTSTSTYTTTYTDPDGVAGNTVEQEAKEATSSEPVTEETPTNGGEE